MSSTSNIYSPCFLHERYEVMNPLKSKAMRDLNQNQKLEQENHQIYKVRVSERERERGYTGETTRPNAMTLPAKGDGDGDGDE